MTNSFSKCFNTFDSWYYKPVISPVYNISQNGISMLKSLEKFKDKAYKVYSNDPKYTIGYGHVIQDGSTSIEINGQRYTILDKTLANTLLMKDLNERFVYKFNIFLRENNINLNQNQYDACILDCYQRGENTWSNQESSISIFIKNKQSFNNFADVSRAFHGSGSGDGRDTRREMEANLFVYGVYNIKPKEL